MDSTCGNATYEESSWVSEGLANMDWNTRPETGQTEKFEKGKEGFDFYRGWDSYGRPWVSNVAYILGGLTHGDVMGSIIQELSDKFGGIIAWGSEINRYKQGSTVHRADWGHPVYIQFRIMEGASRAFREYSNTKQRPDDCGRRTLKLEHSLVEFRIDEGEKWDRMCTRRVSAGEDVEFFIRDAYLKVDGNSEDFEVMWQPSNVGLATTGGST